MSRTAHWNSVYTTKSSQDVSWFEERPDVSLSLMSAAGLTASSCVIDIGGGDSHLVDALLARELHCITVLDISAAALTRARTRLGPSASIPTWIEADVTGDWSVPPVDVWHDRAVFHFLTERADRERYITRLNATLKSGGTAVIATFALDGPAKCSGLPVMRYSPETLVAELGDGFTLADSRAHVHVTPWGATQAFQYSRLTRIA